MTYILAVLISGVCLGMALMIGVVAVLMAVHDAKEDCRRLRNLEKEGE